MEEKRILQILFRLSRIPLARYTRDWQLRECFTTIQQPAQAFEENMLEQLKKELETREICFLPYGDQVSIGICGCRTGDSFFVLGPFSYGKTDRFYGGNFIRMHRIRECPACRLEDVAAVAGFLLGEEEPKGLGREVPEEALNRELVVQEEIRQLDAFQKNHTYQEERVLYEYIREGNVEALKQQEFDRMPSHPILIEDLKKNEEYMTVISISMAARAAIEGGLSSAEGFLNNDVYLKKLSRCKSVFEMDRLRRESQIYFAGLVAEHKKKSGINLHVEEVKRSILSRRFQKVSLEELAEEQEISKEYMQKLFKKHEGMSITEYMKKVKMEAACNLLKYSDRSIREIAQYLQYGSLSHFSAAFRREMELSPREYRDRNRQTVF